LKNDAHFYVSHISFLGNTLATGLALKYKNSNDVASVLKMLVTTGANKKQAQVWIVALQKV
jgi:hypothetical protein